MKDALLKLLHLYWAVHCPVTTYFMLPVGVEKFTIYKRCISISSYKINKNNEDEPLMGYESGFTAMERLTSRNQSIRHKQMINKLG